MRLDILLDSEQNSWCYYWGGNLLFWAKFPIDVMFQREKKRMRRNEREGEMLPDCTSQRVRVFDLKSNFKLFVCSS